jgi:hypothetical protein
MSVLPHGFVRFFPQQLGQRQQWIRRGPRNGCRFFRSLPQPLREIPILHRRKMLGNELPFEQFQRIRILSMIAQNRPLRPAGPVNRCNPLHCDVFQ